MTPASGEHVPRVVVAPDKFRGSMSAVAAAAAIARGVRLARPECEVVEFPIADGGEGTVEMMVRRGYTLVETTVRGPLGAPTTASYAIDGTTAVIEMSAAAGMALLGAAGPDRRSALAASTFGVGELIADALDRGATTVVVGVGGSATSDGGAGALQALGAVLDTGPDARGRGLAGGVAELLEARSLDLTGLDERVARTRFIVASDVDNPLLGARGTATVFAPQKGASTAVVALIEEALTTWADVVARATGLDLRSSAGAGAAGGLAFGMTSVLGAVLSPGADWLLDLTGFAEAARGADLVIVGEGSLDRQSLGGKAPVSAARIARGVGVPVVAVVGRTTITEDEAVGAGLDGVYPLTDLEPDLEACIASGPRLVEDVACRAVLEHLGV